MYFTTAKFNSVCSETGVKIRKGETMLYDKVTRKCYSINSLKAKNERENISTGQMIEANETTFFDNFCVSNNI